MGQAHQKRLTFEERQLIEKYLKEGKSCSQIANLIGRSKNGVGAEVRKRGGKLYNAKAAQENADVTNKARYEKLSKINSGRAYRNKCLERIEILEMQVEILHETIKGLLNDKQN